MGGIQPGCDLEMARPGGSGVEGVSTSNPYFSLARSRGWERFYGHIVSYADWQEGKGEQTATELAAREFMLANRKIGAAVFDVWWHEHCRRRQAVK